MKNSILKFLLYPLMGLAFLIFGIELFLGLIYFIDLFLNEQQKVASGIAITVCILFILVLCYEAGKLFFEDV